MNKVYRIRIEQRPGENHKRYYPEEYTDFKWKNTPVNQANQWYKTQMGAEKHIDELIELRKDYTESIVEYPKKTNDKPTQAV
jgi:hypothetical protein